MPRRSMLSIIPRSAALGIAVIHRKGYTSVLCAIRGVQTKAPSSSEIQPIDRSHEQTEVKRRRLVWQTRKRGILESDLLLSTFASKSLPTMSHKELEEFDQLLDHMDWDIFHWASGAKAAPEEVKSMSIFKKLEEHCQSRTNKGVRMPDL